MVKRTIAFLLFVCTLLAFASCVGYPNAVASTAQHSSEKGSNASEKDNLVFLSTKDYKTSAELISDLLKYCSDTAQSSLYLYALNNNTLYLRSNSSAEKLISKDLIEEMSAKRITPRSIGVFVWLFQGSWNTNKTLAVWDDEYDSFIPLYAVMLFAETNGTNTTNIEKQTALFESIEKVLKENIDNPNSLYFSYSYVPLVQKHYLSVAFHIRCKGENTGYYVDQNGHYKEPLYFCIEYKKKDNTGENKKYGAWLSYDKNGNVRWENDVVSDAIYPYVSGSFFELFGSVYGNEKNINKIGYLSFYCFD